LNNTGQCCIAAKRFIVVEAIADRFFQQFQAAMVALRPGDPMDAATTLGPLSTEEALLKLLDQVQRAVDAGAKLVMGGQRIDRPGFFMQARISSDIAPGNPAFRAASRRAHLRRRGRAHGRTPRAAPARGAHEALPRARLLGAIRPSCTGRENDRSNDAEQRPELVHELFLVNVDRLVRRDQHLGRAQHLGGARAEKGKIRLRQGLARRDERHEGVEGRHRHVPRLAQPHEQLSLTGVELIVRPRDLQ
jgi:hypothetical protein